MQPAIRNGIIQAAQALGIDPADLATIISYETGGTFNPTQPGPRTQWGQHRGFLQFGEPQARENGVNWDDPINSQLGANGAVVRYLKRAGVKPGMGMMDVYSAVNAGSVGRYGASDAHNGGAPGTVADKVRYQMDGHRANAQALLGDTGGYTAAGFGHQPGTYSGGEYVPAQRSVNYVPSGGASGTAMGGFSGGPAQVAARSTEGVSVAPAAASGGGGKGGPGNSPYERQLRAGMAGDRSQREIEQVMSNVGQGGGIKMPSLPSMGGGKGGGGGKSGGGGGGMSAGMSGAPQGASVQPLSAPPPADMGPTPPVPAMKPLSQNMSRPEVQGPKEPYFKNVDDSESKMWESGPGQWANPESPGGVPYEPKDSPLWDPKAKKFVPRLRPDVIR